MKFTLKAYSDLGRCSMGTLLDEFDTDTYKILDRGKEVTIRSVEDLFPYLWQTPGVAFHSEGKHVADFCGTGTHWHHDFDDSILGYEKDIRKLEKKVDKATDPKKKARYQEDLDWAIHHVQSLKDMLKRLDTEMEEQKKQLIEENK
jgi:hypothetical protein